jgi:chromatin structure-remodeling complex subunit SFH1
VQIATHILRDRIEWDLCSPLPPSQFTSSYIRDLGLTGEAGPLIAHAIHEELLKHKKDALELDLFALTHPLQQARFEKGVVPKTVGDRRRVRDRGGGGGRGAAAGRGPEGLKGVWRDWGEREEFGPVLLELGTEEMERREQERAREARRMMRTMTQSKRRR